MVKINGQAIDPEQLPFKKVQRTSLELAATKMPYTFEVETLEGIMRGHAGDYLVRGLSGEYYPIKAELFERTYEGLEGEGDQNAAPQPEMTHSLADGALHIEVVNADAATQGRILAAVQHALQAAEQQA